MEELLKLKKFYELKRIHRLNTNGNRKESSAEHSWSCLILSDYFFPKDIELDKLKVYELLMYHDVVEIEAGDTILHPENTRGDKEKLEKTAALILKEQLPDKLAKKFHDLFVEFEEGKTPESKFAKAVDKLDAIIQGIDHKPNWKGWTREFIIRNKEKEIAPFPKMQEKFIRLLNYLEQEGYFNQ